MMSRGCVQHQSDWELGRPAECMSSSLSTESTLNLLEPSCVSSLLRPRKHWRKEMGRAVLLSQGRAAPAQGFPGLSLVPEVAVLGSLSGCSIHTASYPV